jgi:hypothetical protein
LEGFASDTLRHNCITMKKYILLKTKTAFFARRICAFICSRACLSAAIFGAVTSVALADGDKNRTEDWMREAWEQPAPSVARPEWVDGARVQAHTRLWLHHRDEPVFTEASKAFREMGVRVITRHVKSGDEDPWWKTATPTKSKDLDLVPDMVASCHGAGLKFIAYYWPMTDRTCSEVFPEAVCLHPDGAVIKHHQRGNFIDITYPAYREVVANRLIELAELGVDGFYFDERHLPPVGVWSKDFVRRFQAATGRPAPRKIDPQDPDYRLFKAFRAAQIEDTFAYWKKRVRERHPDIVFIISTTTIASLGDREMTTNLVRLADLPKSEFELAVKPMFNPVFLNNPDLAKPDDDIKMALGWTYLRESADGRPPHIWRPNSPGKAHAVSFAGVLLTYGCVANIDVHESWLPGAKPGTPGAAAREGAQAAFELGAKASPVLAGTRPVRWAAVHISELMRDRRDDLTAWREVLWPAVGAFEVLTRARLPVATVNDFQLEHGMLEGYRVLFLPGEEELGARQKEAVARFRARGGVVIGQRPEWKWDEPAKHADACAALTKEFEALAAPLVRVCGGIPTLHTVAYQEKNGAGLVIAITNEFAWSETTRVLKRAGRSPAAAPAPVTGVSVLICNRESAQVVEVISGRELPTRHTNEGLVVDVPDFDCLALIKISPASP